MQRTKKTVYRTDYHGTYTNFDLLEISNGTASLCNAHRTWTADDLRQLATAAAAAAEELEATEELVCELDA